jgi:hypothetical protein
VQIVKKFAIRHPNEPHRTFRLECLYVPVAAVVRGIGLREKANRLEAYVDSRSAHLAFARALSDAGFPAIALLVPI